MKFRETNKGIKVDFRDPLTKKRIRSTLPVRTITEARRLVQLGVATKNMNLTLGEILGRRAKTSLKQSIADYKRLISPQKSESAQRLDQFALDSFLGHLGEKALENIECRDIEEFRAYLRNDRGLKPASTNRYFNSLKAFFNWVRTTQKVKHELDPALKLLRPDSREARPLLDEEIAAMRLAADTELRFQMDLALNLGLRKGEVASLTWKAFDFSRKKVQIGGIAGFLTKSRKNRTLPLNEALIEKILVYRQNQSPRSNWLFPDTTGTAPIKAERISRKWGRVRERSGVEDVVFHDLRATFACRLAEAGFGDAVIAKLLGHSSAAMARKYSNRVDDSVLENAVAAIAKASPTIRVAN